MALLCEYGPKYCVNITYNHTFCAVTTTRKINYLLFKTAAHLLAAIKYVFYFNYVALNRVRNV